MIGNNNQQWYLHTFKVKGKANASEISNFLKNILLTGEQYVCVPDNDNYLFQVHTTLKDLNNKKLIKRLMI